MYLLNDNDLKHFMKINAQRTGDVNSVRFVK